METEIKKSTLLGRIKKHKKIILGIIIYILTLLVIYFGMVIFFMNHFYFGSSINGVNVSGESVDYVNKQMMSELNTYKLSIKERGGVKEIIKSNEVGLKYNSDGQFKGLKDRQNPYKWISAFFNINDYKMNEKVKYDKVLLNKRVDELSCFDSSNIIEPKSPSFKYTNNGYVIVSEVSGNKVNKGILYDRLSYAILNDKTTIELDSINCYVKPLYTSNSKKIIDTKNKLNKYVFSKITYIFGEQKELLDSSIINKWFRVDKNIKVIFDEKGVKNYIDALSTKYNTIGKSKKFVTSSANKININGGDYGRSINRVKETQALVSVIKEGKTIEKEPAYSQTALAKSNNDMGNTYVEINLKAQHLWFYKNGTLIVQGDIVTGNVSLNDATPVGVYKLKYKGKDAILRGKGYASPVTFWMPFNGGIGIHDASWRSLFGGNIYKSNGSHGCINSPYYLAKAIFNNIEESTPIVCYN